MKFDSPLFDSIRVKPDQDRRVRASAPTCEWPGCQEAATHRAPKGRADDRQYWGYCFAHARDYNQSYNYFSGMSAEEVLKYQRDALPGHRPTWKMGQGAAASSGRSGTARFSKDGAGVNDPFNLFEGGAKAKRDAGPAKEARVIGNAQRKALEVMGFEAGATAQEIKIRFKELVKRHHPDTNGGDRSTEDRLREIIQAYNYLKSLGFR